MDGASLAKALLPGGPARRPPRRGRGRDPGLPAGPGTTSSSRSSSPGPAPVTAPVAVMNFISYDSVDWGSHRRGQHRADLADPAADGYCQQVHRPVAVRRGERVRHDQTSQHRFHHHRPAALRHHRRAGLRSHDHAQPRPAGARAARRSRICTSPRPPARRRARRCSPAPIRTPTASSATTSRGAIAGSRIWPRPGYRTVNVGKMHTMPVEGAVRFPRAPRDREQGPRPSQPAVLSRQLGQGAISCAGWKSPSRVTQRRRHRLWRPAWRLGLGARRDPAPGCLRRRRWRNGGSTATPATGRSSCRSACRGRTRPMIRRRTTSTCTTAATCPRRSRPTPRRSRRPCRACASFISDDDADGDRPPGRPDAPSNRGDSGRITTPMSP